MYQKWYIRLVDASTKKLPALFYRTDAGNEPVREWLRSLDKEERRMIGEDIRTAEYGWPVGMPICRSMGGGIFEIRTDLRSKIARVLFCTLDDSMYLLHGFIKKTRKTPSKDLELAKRRKKDLEKEIKATRRERK